jgi:hypothetical protein
MNQLSTEREAQHLLRCAIALVMRPRLSKVAGESRAAIAQKLQAALAAAPTPPAQEAEPVYQRRFANYDEAAWFDVSRAEFDAENVIEKRIVYTHAPSDELRRAAEEVLRVYDKLSGDYNEIKDSMEKLRSALEGKS